MKKFLWLFALLACVTLAAGGQMVVFGKPGRLNFSQYPLKINTFDFKKGTKLNDENRRLICEALDNSKFVFFANEPETFLSIQLFGTPDITQSLKGLLERGGIIYMGCTDWSKVVSRPKAMHDFFKSIGIALPGAANYCDTAPKGKGERSEKGTLVPEFAQSLFNTPKAAGTFDAIRHFGDMSRSTMKPLVKAKNGMILMVIQENLVGKGKFISSYAYSVCGFTESPFIENILTSLYGPMRKMSAREKMKQQTKAAAFTETPVFDLSKQRTVDLVLSKTKGTPVNKTKVKLSGNADTMIAEFFCSGNKAPRTTRNRHDDTIWNDDCVEIAIANSLNRDCSNYHFIVNSKGFVYDAKNSSSAWNCKNLKVQTKVSGKEYYVKLEIPVKEFKLGKIFRMNVGRESWSFDKAGKDKVELSSWNAAVNGFAALDTMKIVSFDPHARLQSKVQNTAGTLKVVLQPAFTKIYSDSEAPAGAQEVKKIHFVLPRNDREVAQIVFYNTTDENYIFRMEPELKSECGDIFSFSELFEWRAPVGEVFSEIETPLNFANLITVPGGANKVVLLAARTSRKPGVYKWNFEIVPVNAKIPTRKVSVTAEVLPLTLKEKELPGGYSFGPYGYSWVCGDRYLPLYWKLYKEHHINQIQIGEPWKIILPKKGAGTITIPEDLTLYTKYEKYLAENGFCWYYGYGVVARFKDMMQIAGITTPFQAPENLKLFEKWIATWAKALKANKVDFNRFYVPLQDEPRTAAVPDLLAAAKILHKYGFRICNTLATWTTIEDIRSLAPVLDQPIPWEPLVTTRSTADETKKLFKAHAKSIMPYLCSISGNYSPYQEYFRFRGIRTFLCGGDAISMWAGNSWRGNEYRSTDDKQMYSGFLVHHGDDRGPVPTYRLEAFREGIEDLYYLKMAQRSSDPAVKALIAPAKLNQVMASDSPAVTAAWRNALVKALSASGAR